MPTHTLLSHVSLTRAIRNVKSPNMFWQRAAFSRSNTNDTETIELSHIVGGREIAPAVRRDGSAVVVGGRSTKFATVTTPNIRIKQPFTPSPLLYDRQPGQPIMGANVREGAMRAIMEDLQHMNDMITNAKEWYCSQALVGVINVQIDDGENFTITYPRPAGNTVVPSNFWTDTTNATPLADIENIKRLASESFGGNVTDAVAGTDADDALIGLLEGGHITAINRDSGIEAGNASLAEQYTADGVIYRGRIGGIRFWSYPRTATLYDGSSVTMVRPKYIEFMNFNNGAGGSDRKIEHGVITDMKALKNNKLQSEIFVKSWEEEDPSTSWYLATSRPLPVTRKADATFSFQAVA